VKSEAGPVYTDWAVVLSRQLRQCHPFPCLQPYPCQGLFVACSRNPSAAGDSVQLTAATQMTGLGHSVIAAVGFAAVPLAELERQSWLQLLPDCPGRHVVDCPHFERDLSARGLLRNVVADHAR